MHLGLSLPVNEVSSRLPCNLIRLAFTVVSIETTFRSTYYYNSDIVNEPRDPCTGKLHVGLRSVEQTTHGVFVSPTGGIPRVSQEVSIPSAKSEGVPRFSVHSALVTDLGIP